MKDKIKEAITRLLKEENLWTVYTQCLANIPEEELPDKVKRPFEWIKQQITEHYERRVQQENAEDEATLRKLMASENTNAPHPLGQMSQKLKNKIKVELFMIYDKL